MRTSTLLIPCLVTAVAFGGPMPRLIAAGPRLAASDNPEKATSAEAAKKASAAKEPAGSDEYQLGPGDKLRVEVYKDAQLSQSVQIRPDGKITLPLVGDIEASGSTPIELRATITKALKEYMTNPVVTVIVVEATAATAYVLGEVNHPGAVALQAPLTILQALAIAGGLKDFADAKNIRILRKSRTGVETIDFNYRDALRGTGVPVYLRPGDTVVVP
jgi:polysaccharide export outer membrane protein